MLCYFTAANPPQEPVEPDETQGPSEPQKPAEPDLPKDYGTYGKLIENITFKNISAKHTLGKASHITSTARKRPELSTALPLIMSQ